MKRNVFILVALGILLALSGFDTADAQSSYAFDEISFVAEEAGFGARALGLAGAYRAAANDYSAIYWNPAGLALVNMTQFYASLTHNKRNLDTGFLNTSMSNSQSKTAIGALGIAYAVDTYQGALVFGFGYNRVHNYNSLFGYDGFNSGASFVGTEFTEAAPGVPFDVLNNLTQNETVEITGGLSQYTLGASAEVAKGIFLGAAFNYWSGNNEYSQIFREDDLGQIWTTVPNDFDYYYRESSIDTDIRGFDLKLGLLYEYTNRVNIGLTLNTPRFLTLEDNWFFDDEIGFDDGFVDTFSEDDPYNYGIVEYKIRTPFVFGGGFAYKFPQGMVTAEVEFTDWPQLEYRDTTPLSGVSDDEANRNIKQTLEGTINPKFGVELRPGNLGFILRGGFALYPSPLKNADSDYDKKFITAGIGLPLGPDGMLDIAYRRGTWKMQSAGLGGLAVEEDHVDNRLFFSVRFNVRTQ